MKTIILFIVLFSVHANAELRDRVQLTVPVVKQGKTLCGPATIEMVFRYWGISKYDQYDIAYNILEFRPEQERVKKSGILDSKTIDWKLYPGTGTSTMREFLKQFSDTENHKYKKLSSTAVQAENQKLKIWTTVRQHLSNGVPVIVHQYWKGTNSRGHYRVVTGYDEKRKIVYLNDANPGARITQSYDEFFRLWNVNEPWLHYNAIAFNKNGEKLHVNLKDYVQ